MITIFHLLTFISLQALVPVNGTGGAGANPGVLGIPRLVSTPLMNIQSRMAGSGPITYDALKNDDWWDYISKEDMYEMDMMSVGTKLSQPPVIVPKLFKIAKDIKESDDKELENWNHEFGDYEAIIRSEAVQLHADKDLLVVPSNDVKVEVILHRHAEHEKLDPSVSAHVKVFTFMILGSKGLRF